MGKTGKKERSPNWGGYREGAGRKREKEKLVRETTKVARISLKDFTRLKNGNYDELMAVLYKHRIALENAKAGKTSPRWQKMRELMNEVDEIFGSDFRSWVEDEN